VVERGCGWRRTQTTVVPADGIFDVDCSTVDGMLESARGSTAFRQTTSTSPSIAWSLAALKKYVPTKGIVVKVEAGDGDVWRRAGCRGAPIPEVGAYESACRMTPGGFKGIDGLIFVPRGWCL
jgi:hypothetical protein